MHLVGGEQRDEDGGGVLLDVYKDAGQVVQGEVVLDAVEDGLAGGMLRMAWQEAC